MKPNTPEKARISLENRLIILESAKPLSKRWSEAEDGFLECYNSAKHMLPQELRKIFYSRYLRAGAKYAVEA